MYIDLQSLIYTLALFILYRIVENTQNSFLLAFSLLLQLFTAITSFH